ISVLFLGGDTSGLATHKIGRRQIRFAQTKVDAIGQGALKTLADQRRLQTTQASRQFKFYLLLSRAHFLSSPPSSSSSSISSRTVPTSTLNSPSACVSGSPVSTPPIVSSSPTTNW